MGEVAAMIYRPSCVHELYEGGITKINSAYMSIQYLPVDEICEAGLS